MQHDTQIQGEYTGGL